MAGAPLDVAVQPAEGPMLWTLHGGPWQAVKAAIASANSPVAARAPPSGSIKHHGGGSGLVGIERWNLIAA